MIATTSPDQLRRPRTARLFWEALRAFVHWETGTPRNASVRDMDDDTRPPSPEQRRARAEAE
jgi:hypothetical protein